MISDKDWLIAKMNLSKTVFENYIQPAIMREWEPTKERLDTIVGYGFDVMKRLEEWMFHDNTRKSEP